MLSRGDGYRGKSKGDERGRVMAKVAGFRASTNTSRLWWQKKKRFVWLEVTGQKFGSQGSQRGIQRPTLFISTIQPRPARTTPSFSSSTHRKASSERNRTRPLLDSTAQCHHYGKHQHQLHCHHWQTGKSLCCMFSLLVREVRARKPAITIYGRVR